MQTDTTQEIINRYGGLRVAQDDELSLYSDDSVFKEPNSAKILPLRKPLRTNVGPQTSPLRHSYSDLLVDRDMDRFIRRPVRKTEADDKTDFMIRETHKLVNEIPASLLQSKEGEKYQHMLSASISKLVSKYEEVVQENETLKNSSDKIKINFLNDKVNSLSKSNNELKSELRDINEDYTKLLNDNTQVRAENELLRTKLIKYKKLYEEQRKATPAVPEAGVNTGRNLDVLAALEELLQKKEVKAPDSKADLLHKFERIASEIKQPEVDLQALLTKNNELYQKLLGVLENNRSSAKVGPEQDKTDQNARSGSQGDSKDVVVKCIMCCPNVGDGTKKKCKRCSTVGSEMSEKDHTLELMGEYKWAL